MSGETPPNFDVYAHAYDALLQDSLEVTGEQKEYFARGRVEWLARCLADRRANPGTILDFGCGTGSTVPIFLERLQPERVIGLDNSMELLEIARRDFADPRATFSAPSQFPECGTVDLAFCSAVFHHIEPRNRSGAARRIYSYLRPGGYFSFWEHNAWSLAARYVMSRCEFDRDSTPLSAGEARTLLREAGFEVLRTDFLFIFPRSLRFLRGLEPSLSKLPVGAQFQVLARRPPASSS